MDRRTLSIAGGLAAAGLLVALYVLRDAGAFTLIIVGTLFAADLVGVYFIMQYGLAHDGLPHVDTVDSSDAVKKLREMNAARLAKVEAGRARAALTAGAEAAPAAAEAAPKRAASRRRAPAGETTDAAPSAE